MQAGKTHLHSIPSTRRRIRMVGCRRVGSRFQGFIGHSSRGYLGDPTYRELSCTSLCRTSSDAMTAARDLLHTLAIKYGFNPG